MKILRTDGKNHNFGTLVQLLDAELAVRDGSDHDFYHQYNGIDDIKYCVLGLENDYPIACGAIKKHDDVTMEVKRMYTLPDYRGKGIASQILTELQHWAKEMGYLKCVLETGKKQPEAIQLYLKSGYKIIANYGQYVGVENSVCFVLVL
ncbi:MAG: GNAT family N-acetyltransferase [Saprospiraceae bacterium]